MNETASNAQPYFSIIIPCYNSEKYLDFSIGSILNQSFQAWEIVAVDDGSIDSTTEILERFASQDPRIKVFHKENGGYCSAVNFGLEKVTGKYFMPRGSYDSLVENALARIYEAACDFAPDMIGFRTVKQKDGKNIGLDSFTKFDTIALETNTGIKEFQAKHPDHARILSVRDTSKFFKTELLGSLRYPGRSGFDADGIFSMLFTHQCRSFLCIPVDGYNWTLRGDSLSGKKVTRAVYEDRLNNWMWFYTVLAAIEPDKITNNEIDYVDYYYTAVWKYAELLHPRGREMKFLKKHTRFLFRLMRKYRITVGNSFAEKMSNYFRLLFPGSTVRANFKKKRAETAPDQ